MEASSTKGGTKKTVIMHQGREKNNIEDIRRRRRNRKENLRKKEANLERELFETRSLRDLVSEQLKNAQILVHLVFFFFFPLISSPLQFLRNPSHFIFLFFFTFI